MTLKDFDGAMQIAAEMEANGGESTGWICRRGAERIRQVAYDEAGLEWHDRGAGFPGWTCGDGNYYNTPRAAMEAKP